MSPQTQELDVSEKVEQANSEENRSKRDKYREIYTDETGGAGATRDMYSLFMLARFGSPDTVEESYAREWARMFNQGRHFYKMDAESQKTMVEVLTTPIDGTASSLGKTFVKEQAENWE